MLRWGILSTARINRRLVAGVRASERSQVVAIASRDLERARTAAAQYGVSRAHGSYHELLADNEVDLVYNPLPNQLHAPWTVRALNAGKHVLCEKPMALSPVQLDVMLRAAERNGRILAEGFMYRHHPRTRHVKALVDGGSIGSLRLAHGAFTFVFGRSGDNYRWDPASGGGALWDVGCYPVSFARYVVGSEPERVEALSVEGESGVDLTFGGVMRFPDGIIATFDCGFDATFRSEMTFVGTTGTLHVPLAFRPGLQSTIEIHRENSVETVAIDGFEPLFLGEVRDMERAILDGLQQEISWAESRGNSATLHALFESARSGHAETPR